MIPDWLLLTIAYLAIVGAVGYLLLLFGVALGAITLDFINDR